MNLKARIRHWLSAAVAMAAMATTSPHVLAQCPPHVLVSGLKFPLGITSTNQGNLIVSETGTVGAPHSGRLSILDVDGNRRTLIDGLPSGTNDVNEPSGPAGILMRGRTLYLAIGIGDTIRSVQPGSPVRVANPNPSSPIFSSILAIHFSAGAEKYTTGLVLTLADHHALAAGEKVSLSNGGVDKVVIEMIANFPDYIAEPLPTFPANVRGSNPFDVELLGNQLYVTDGGRNVVWRLDIPTGEFNVLTAFPNTPNPLFNAVPPPPSLGGPFLEAVPTGIREFQGQLLVTLFRGFPFPAGTSVVEQVNPATGEYAPVIAGLKTAIDVIPTTVDGEATDFLVLQHASGSILSGSGSLTRFSPSGSPVVLADCLLRSTSMTRDDKSGAVYITEIVNGRVVVVQ